MTKFYKREFIRNDKRKLLLFGYKNHNENAGSQLEINNIPNPHMRWNPSRQEWVTYNAERKNRTSFPPKEYCPLCPGKSLDYPTEIPFDGFEIAIFPVTYCNFCVLLKK